MLSSNLGRGNLVFVRVDNLVSTQVTYPRLPETCWCGNDAWKKIVYKLSSLDRFVSDDESRICYGHGELSKKFLNNAPSAAARLPRWYLEVGGACRLDESMCKWKFWEPKPMGFQLIESSPYHMATLKNGSDTTRASSYKLRKNDNQKERYACTSSWGSLLSSFLFYFSRHFIDLWGPGEPYAGLYIVYT